MSQNHDIFNTIAEQAKHATLSEKEKTTLFRTVDAYVRKHPISARVPVRATASPFSGSRWMAYLGANHSSAMSFAVVVFVVLGAGTSFAAQGSLPGDLLYAVKVGINEQVRAALSSNAGKAVYEATRAVERLKEGRALEAQGKLTPALQTQIEARFEEHAARVQKDAVDLTNAGEYSTALKVSEQFETALKNEEAALGGAIADKVKTTIETSAAVRVTTEDTIVASESNSDEVRKVAQEKQAQARALITAVTQSVAARAVVTPVAPAHVQSIPANTSASPVSAKKASMSAKTTALAPTVAPASASALVTATATPQKTDDVFQSALAYAQGLVQQGDELFAIGKYNEAFSAYRAAQDAATQVRALLQGGQ